MSEIRPKIGGLLRGSWDLVSRARIRVTILIVTDHSN